MIAKLLALHRWFHTFKGSLLLAGLSFLCLISDIQTQSYIMAWVMGFCTVYWLWLAKLVINQPSEEERRELTEDQQNRLQAAYNNLYKVMKEVQDETKAEDIALKLKAKEKENADVQCKERTNKEASFEGTDRRTDRKEDRLP